MAGREEQSGGHFLGALRAGREGWEDEKWSERNAFIFGSENKGLKQLTLKKIDCMLKININKLANSLNVSNAVTACLSIYRSKN